MENNIGIQQINEEKNKQLNSKLEKVQAVNERKIIGRK